MHYNSNAQPRSINPQRDWHSGAPSYRSYNSKESPTVRWPWEGPGSTGKQTLYFSKDIYNTEPEATSLALGRSMGIYIKDDATRARLVESKYVPERHPPMPVFMRQCLNMVWLSDDFQNKVPRGRPAPKLTAEERTACLAFMWAVQHDKTIEEGEAALEAARHVGWDELLKVLALEIGNATMASAALGATGAAAYGLGAASAGAASKAWALGTLAGKAKAAAFVFTGFWAVAIVATVGVAVVGQGVRNHKDLETWRHECNATQFGRDALFCEIVTHRRYRRKQIQP